MAVAVVNPTTQINRGPPGLLDGRLALRTTILGSELIHGMTLLVRLRADSSVGMAVYPDRFGIVFGAQQG